MCAAWTPIAHRGLGDGSSSRSSRSSSFVLVSLAVAMVRDDEALETALTGSLPVGEDLQMLAFCVNAVDWMTDQTLDLPVMIATDPALVRAAELAADAQGADADLIAAVENAYWERDGDLAALEQWRDDIADPVRRGSSPATWTSAPSRHRTWRSTGLSSTPRRTRSANRSSCTSTA